MPHDPHSGLWSCEACGYSLFHYAHEFADGDPFDVTRICRDCGHAEPNALDATTVRALCGASSRTNVVA